MFRVATVDTNEYTDCANSVAIGLKKYSPIFALHCFLRVYITLLFIL